MIKHLVFWRLNGATASARATQAQEIKATLEALNGRIPGLLYLEVGIDFNGSENAADVALYSELESRDALAAYQQHPEHVKAAAVVGERVRERRVVDYEV